MAPEISLFTPFFRRGTNIQFVPTSDTAVNLQVNFSNFAILNSDNTENIRALYTGGIADCAAMAVIQKDAQGKILRIGLAHFDGGLIDDTCTCIKQRLANEGFRDNTQLFFCPGVNYNERAESITNVINRNFPRPQYDYSIKCGQQSCCVSLMGEVGTFYYDNARSRLESNRSPIYVIPEKDDKDLHHYLAPYKISHPQAAAKLSQFVAKLPQNIKKELIEITCNSLAQNIFSSPKNNGEMIAEYRVEVSKLPVLSTMEKNICIALVATIIGIVPVALFGLYSFFAAKERNEQISKNFQAILGNAELVPTEVPPIST